MSDDASFTTLEMVEYKKNMTSIKKLAYSDGMVYYYSFTLKCVFILLLMAYAW